MGGEIQVTINFFKRFIYNSLIMDADRCIFFDGFTPKTIIHSHTVKLFQDDLQNEAIVPIDEIGITLKELIG